MTDHIAGRELDAKIAERVMGWKLTCPVDPSCDFSVGFRRTGESARRNFCHNGEKEIPIPPFSADIGAAWLVVEKMRANGRRPLLNVSTSCAEGEWHCAVDVPHGDQPYTHAYGPAPLAVCLVALSLACPEEDDA